MSTARRALASPPGGVLLWLVVALELLTFGLVFAAILRLRLVDPVAFRAGQGVLSVSKGLALTVLLVTSGLLAAEAVHDYRVRRWALSRWLFVAAGGLGVGFIGLKVRDFAGLVASGHRLGTNDFWDTYFLATGFHLAHVVVGVGLLLGVAARVGRTTFGDPETAIVGSALFWHLCDLAWFFLFPLFFARG